MIATFGKFILFFALIGATLQSLFPIIGYRKNCTHYFVLAKYMVYTQVLFLAIGYVLLTLAFINNDFNLFYVATNSHPDLPLIYRATAVWGAHEGSILLWCFLLSLWTLLFSFVSYDNQIKPLSISILGFISVGFLLFLIFTSNPFLNSPYPLAPSDLNPLLQDPGFVTHPPILYTGYVGFAVPFAMTLAAMIFKELNHEWAHVTRLLTLATWCFLTLGITLGSWWAYRVLGWGGFWFWDPVENASLLPWLAGVALLHVLVLVEKKSIGKNWAAFLTIITFALSVFGTFLVRSGVLVSAHTFANDPKRGVFLLLMFTIVMSISLGIYFWRMEQNQSKTFFSVFSKEMALLINSGLIIIMMLTILLGTLYPLILDAFKLGSISVGAPYFNTVLAPFILLFLLFMAVAPFYRWEKNFNRTFFKTSFIKLFFSFLFTFALICWFGSGVHLLALILLTLCVWLALNLSLIYKLKLGMAVTHIGFALLIIGIVASSLWSIESQVKVKPGEVTSVGPYHFLFIDYRAIQGPNYLGIQAAFEVTKNTRHVVNLYPEKRIYKVRQMVMTKVDIHPSIFRDLYLALGEPLDGNYWTVRMYYKPLMRFVWLGGFIMMLGAAIAIIQKRKRVIT